VTSGLLRDQCERYRDDENRGTRDGRQSHIEKISRILASRRRRRDNGAVVRDAQALQADEVANIVLRAPGEVDGV